MSTPLRSLALRLALCATPLVAHAQSADETFTMEFSCADRVTLTAFERNVVARQERGPGELRRYLYINRSINNMLYADAVRLADRVHARQRTCARYAVDEAPRIEAAK